ncbi:MAG TPA: cation:proton antiporter [Gemmatimonadaceae bacterium]|nr:cation:proton antiporter [Gemmatimonadaceae bacterium]
MRRVIILALLLGGMRLVLPLGTGSGSGHSLLTFGFLILAAYTTGELATAARLPRIVGYLVAGVVFGPSALDIVTVESARELAPVSSLAIALIAFLAGAELRWSELRERGRAIGTILTSELAITFVALAGLLVGLRDHVPFLQSTPTPTVIGFSLLFASIAVVHSPAVTMALLTETGARGPVARTTLGVVLVSDVVVIVLFSAVLAIARALVPPSAGDVAAISLGSVVWELVGAVVVGSALGAAVALYLRFVKRELMLFAVLVTFFGSEIARLAHVETLLTLLTAGFVMENISRDGDGDALRHAMERSGAPVFVVFFALAGAAMAVKEVVAIWPLVIPIVLVRAAGIWTGSRVGARWARVPSKTGNLVWMGLISQAGVAIGLATVIAEVYPTRGAPIRTLFLATLAVNQIVGPILFRMALARGGELGEGEAEVNTSSPATSHA